MTRNYHTPLVRIVRTFATVLEFVVAGFCLWPRSVCGQEVETAPHLDQAHPIFAAVRSGKLAAIAEQLDHGTPVNGCTEYGETLLRVALQAGQLEAAREILRRGFKPTMIFRSGNSHEFVAIGDGALSLAATLGAEDIVEVLLARGSTAYPVLFGEEHGFLEPPVLCAIKADQPRMLQKLLASVGPDLANEKVRENSFEYLEACRSLASIDILVKYGLDVEALGRTVPSPHVLHAYAKRGWKEGLEKILSLGADASQPMRSADTLPEEVAATPELRDLLRIAALRIRVARARASGADGPTFPIELVEGAIRESEAIALERIKRVPAAELSAVDDRGWTPLNYALRYRFLKLAHVLVDRGTDVSNITSFGSCEITFAASSGDLELVKKMAARKADVNASANGRPTALLLATEQRNLPMVELLLSLGAQVEPPRPVQKDAPWKNALMVACKAGDLPLMDRLLKAGGDIHAVDSSGENVVFYAARSGKPEVLHWVLNHGAYLQLKTPRGTNALTLAASLGLVEMIKELDGLGLTHPDAVHYAQSSGNDAAVDYLEKKHQQANPDDPAYFWNRSNITTEEVRRYIAAGRDMDYGIGCPTPLQQLASQGNVEAVALLLEKGADPRKRGHLAGSAVFMSLGSERYATALVRLFVEHGISPNEREYLYGLVPPETKPSGITLLAVAIKLGYLDCGRYLLEKGANPYLRDALTGQDAFDELRTTMRIGETERTDFRLLMEGYAKRFTADSEAEDVVTPLKKTRAL